jgi:hypothetical protein
MPPLYWPAILAGVALAAVAAVASAALLPPIPAAVASFFGIFVSGYFAGKLAPGARVYHGALVGAGFVVCEVLGLAPAIGSSADAVTDTLRVIAADAFLIAAAAAGGWAARLWSSSDMGIGR